MRPMLKNSGHVWIRNSNSIFNVSFYLLEKWFPRELMTYLPSTWETVISNELWRQKSWSNSRSSWFRSINCQIIMSNQLPEHHKFPTNPWSMAYLRFWRRLSSSWFRTTSSKISALNVFLCESRLFKRAVLSFSNRSRWERLSCEKYRLDAWR